MASTHSTNQHGPTMTHKIIDGEIYTLKHFGSIYAVSLETAYSKWKEEDSSQWLLESCKEFGYRAERDHRVDEYHFVFYGYLREKDWTFYKMKYG